MDGALLILFLVLAGVLALGMAASAWGVDSRELDPRGYGVGGPIVRYS